MQIESCGHPNVESNKHLESHKRAKGLFQVMPFNFGSGENYFDPETNASRGLEYLQRSYILAEGDIEKALAGYNGGHLAILWNPETWSQETQDYVHWGAGILSDITHGREQSPILQEWLESGGKNLCEDAKTALGL